MTVPRLARAAWASQFAGTLRPPGHHGMEPGSSTAEPEAVGDPQRSTVARLSFLLGSSWEPDVESSTS